MNCSVYGCITRILQHPIKALKDLLNLLDSKQSVLAPAPVLYPSYTFTFYFLFPFFFPFSDVNMNGCRTTPFNK